MTISDINDHSMKYTNRLFLMTKSQAMGALKMRCQVVEDVSEVLARSGLDKCQVALPFTYMCKILFLLSLNFNCYYL